VTPQPGQRARWSVMCVAARNASCTSLTVVFRETAFRELREAADA